MSEPTTLTGRLTLMQAVAVGVNTTSPAFPLAAILAPMALLVGYATPIVLIVSFIPMALTSVAFMYLNRRDPDCGTTFSWVSRALGPRPGFIAGWTIAAAGVLVLGSLAETAIAYGLLTFGLDGLAGNALLIRICATVLIIVMTGLSILGTESSVRLQAISTFLQVGILLIFVIAAAVLAVRTTLPSFNSDWIKPLSQGMPHLIAAMLLGVFAFWGWEAATNLSEECRKPSDAGKAGVISTVILLTTYVSVAIFVVMYLGESGFYPVGESGLVLVDMSSVVLGPLAFLVLLAVALSALASTQSTMVPGSRAVLSMARRGALPAELGLTHPRFKSPWVSLALLGGIAATWYFLISSISENAMVDTLSSLGILVAFYYSSVLLVGTACSSSDQTTESNDTQALATELVDRYVLAVFDRDPAALGDLLTDAYLLRRSDGSGYDRQGYMDALKEGSDYELVSYQITDITAQQDGEILVAMFTLDADVQENGRSVLSTPSPSLVTFVRVDGEWKLASDAFFSK